MKLPEVRYRQVQSVGRHDLGAVSALASATKQQGQVRQQGMEVLAGVTNDYLVRKQNAEYDDQVASMQIDFDEWNSKYSAKDFYTAEDVLKLKVPEHLVKRTESYDDDSGAKLIRERQDIPAYEVYPHILRQKLSGMASVRAEKISNPHLRREFLRKASVNEANLNMQAAFNAENQQEKHMLEKGIFDYQKAGDAGDVQTGLRSIAILETDDVHKQKLTQDLYYRAEFADVVGAIRSNEPETVATYLSRYTDPNYDGDLPEHERQAAVRDLTTKLKVLGADRAEERDRQEGIRFVQMTEKVKTGGSSLAEIQEGFDKYVADANDKDGWTDQQYSRLMDLQRGYETSVDVEERRQEVEARRLANEQEAAARAEQVQFDKAYKQQNSLFFSQAHKLIDDGELHEVDIERSFEEHLESLRTGVPNPNTIDAKQRTTLRHHIMERDNKRVKATQDYVLGKGIVDGVIPSNREYGDHQRGVDEYVKQDEIGDVPSLVRITQDTNIMPQVLENMIVHSALNMQESDATPGLAAYGAVLDSNKHGLLDLSGPTRDLMNDAWYYHRAGMSATESLEKANELSQLSEAERDFYKKQYTEGGHYDDNVSKLSSKMEADEDSLYPFDPGWLSGALDPNSPMSASYQYIVAKEFERTGNIDMSRETAWNVLTETWGPTGVGVHMSGMKPKTGSRPARYGVERTLGIHTGAANDRLAAFSEAHGVEVGTVLVKSDGFTARDNSSWDIMTVDPETGMLNRIYNAETGLPVRWTPNDWIEQGEEYRHRVGTAKALRDKAARESFEDEEAYRLAN